MQYIEYHHVLPILASWAHLNWHLENLFQGGWKTTCSLTTGEHKKEHKRIGRPQTNNYYRRKSGKWEVCAPMKRLK